MWVTVVLVGLVLVLSRWARVEAAASANRLAAVEAAMATRAGEQYVLSQVEEAGGDAIYALESPAEAVPVGGAYFWVIRPDHDDDGVRDFGILDEGSKVNLNTADREALVKLPGMTYEVADAIIDWRDANTTVSESGAEDEYYQMLPQPYRAKNAPFETVEELLLVRGITPELLFGLDANRNGFLDEEETAAGGGAAGGAAGGVAGAFGGQAAPPRGIFPFVSVHGSGTPPATGQGGGGGGGGGGQAPSPGRINVNTAPKEVLYTLPGLEMGDATTLVAQRANAQATTNTDWVAQALTAEKRAAIMTRITGQSYVFTADIVGVSGDGRAYHRVRVIVNAAQAPARIVYRRDLTDAGWPLGPDVRQVLRSGGQLAPPSAPIRTSAAQ